MQTIYPESSSVQSLTSKNIALPIDEYLPAIRKAVSVNSVVLIQATPGAGKTTRVPPALLDIVEGKILVLEPRRLAARLAAERVANELGEECGSTVGFQIRYESKESAQTRIKFITEGLLVRLILQNPTLEGIDCVILDEFHERNIHTDIAYMLLTKLQQNKRPNLKLIIMSATLELNYLQQKLPHACTIDVQGKVFPVTTEYLPESSTRPLEIQILLAVERLFVNPNCSGSILVFLPGTAEIKRAYIELENYAQKNSAELLQLYSELPWQEQQNVFQINLDANGRSKRKIILSTNIAETSVTIPGITGVIDSGLAKIAGYAHWSGFPTLDTKQTSQASCIQRAGRAGRTCAGVALRLFTNYEFSTRQKFDKPELLRSDLSQMLLELCLVSSMLGEELKVTELPWLDFPPEAQITEGINLLVMLGAVTEKMQLTKIGEEMARYPLAPRLSRILIAGIKGNYYTATCYMVALLQEGMLLRASGESYLNAESDVLHQLELLQKSLQKKSSTHIDVAKIKRIEKNAISLARIAKLNLTNNFRLPSFEELAEFLLPGFPDRVMQVKQTPNKNNKHSMLELVCASGGGALLAISSVVQNAEYLIALDAEEKNLGAKGGVTVMVRVASQISAEVLALSDNSFVNNVEKIYFDYKTAKVRKQLALSYGSIILEENNTPITGELAEKYLIAQVMQEWPLPFESVLPLEEYAARCKIVEELGGSVVFPDYLHSELQGFIKYICQGKNSYAEISSQSIEAYLTEILSYEATSILNKFAPTHIFVGKNHKVKVNYSLNQAPWISSRMQDFFGSLQTPCVGDGKIPLVVHLLAPNRRAVQVTTDLTSFWQTAYGVVRKELCRKYPRHYWPEDPKNAEPPEYKIRKTN